MKGIFPDRGEQKKAFYVLRRPGRRENSIGCTTECQQEGKNNTSTESRRRKRLTFLHYFCKIVVSYYNNS